MEFRELEKAAKLAGKRIPVQWREDVEQQVIADSLELQTKGVTLTPANVSAIAVQVIDYAFRHWIHDQHGRERQRTISLDTVVQTVDGENITLADCLPNPHYLNRVEDYILARLALQSLPPRIARIAASGMIDNPPTWAKRELKAWRESLVPAAS